jgi:glucosylceramidase
MRGIVEVSGNTFNLTPEFHILGQLSKFLEVGAVRIASTMSATLLSVAFRNPDGSIVVLLYNADETSTDLRSVVVAVNSLRFEYQLPSLSALTAVLRPAE